MHRGAAQKRRVEFRGALKRAGKTYTRACWGFVLPVATLVLRARGIMLVACGISSWRPAADRASKLELLALAAGFISILPVGAPAKRIHGRAETRK